MTKQRKNSNLDSINNVRDNPVVRVEFEVLQIFVHVAASLEMKNAFTELRKAANHPLLRRIHYQTSLLVQMAKLLKKYVRNWLINCNGVTGLRFWVVRSEQNYGLKN